MHLYIHKRLYGKCLLYLYELLTCNFDIHNRSSRYGAVNFVCPRYKRETEGVNHSQCQPADSGTRFQTILRSWTVWTILRKYSSNIFSTVLMTYKIILLYEFHSFY